MVTIECTTRKWGSSIGVIIPKEIANQERIVPGKKIVFEIKKKITVGDVFGSLAGWRRTAEELKKEAKRGWK